MVIWYIFVFKFLIQTLNSLYFIVFKLLVLILIGLFLKNIINIKNYFITMENV
jgi:hypothetical protein